MIFQHAKTGNVWAAVLLLGIGAGFGTSLEARTFTATDGRTIEAKVLKLTGDSAVLKRQSGINVTVPLTSLIEADRKFLAEWAKEEAKNRIPRVKVSVNSNKRDSQIKAGYDERMGSFQFRIEIANGERDFRIEKATATLIVLGDYLYRPGVTTVMQRAEFKNISMDFGKTFVMNGQEVRYEYYRDYNSGQKYSGYVFILKNASGKVINVSGSSSYLENQADLIAKLKEGDFCNKQFQKLKTDRSGSTKVLN